MSTFGRSSAIILKIKSLRSAICAISRIKSNSKEKIAPPTIIHYSLQTVHREAVRRFAYPPKYASFTAGSFAKSEASPSLEIFPVSKT